MSATIIETENATVPATEPEPGKPGHFLERTPSGRFGHNKPSKSSSNASSQQSKQPSPPVPGSLHGVPPSKLRRIPKEAQFEFLHVSPHLLTAYTKARSHYYEAVAWWWHKNGKRRQSQPADSDFERAKNDRDVQRAAEELERVDREIERCCVVVRNGVTQPAVKIDRDTLKWVRSEERALDREMKIGNKRSGSESVDSHSEEPPAKRRKLVGDGAEGATLSMPVSVVGSVKGSRNSTLSPAPSVVQVTPPAAGPVVQTRRSGRFQRSPASSASTGDKQSQ